jgi:hypothetical protein
LSGVPGILLLLVFLLLLKNLQLLASLLLLLFAAVDPAVADVLTRVRPFRFKTFFAWK